MSDLGANQAENPLGQAEREESGEILEKSESRFENKQEAIRAAMEKFKGLLGGREKAGKLDAGFVERTYAERITRLFRTPNSPDFSEGDLIFQKTIEAARMAADVMYPKLRRLQESAKTAGEIFFTRESEEIESLLRQASESDDPVKAIESANSAIDLFEKVTDDAKRERDESYKLKRGLIDDANQNASRAMFLNARTKDILGGEYNLEDSAAERYEADSKVFAADIEKDVAEGFGSDRKFLDDLRAAIDEFRAIAKEIGSR
jgi:hypothetical protein